MHTLALHDAWRLQLECTTPVGGNLAEPVDWGTQRINHATQISVSYCDGEDFTRAGDLHAFDDAGEFTEHDDTDLVLVEVERQAESPVAEAKEFIRHRARKALDMRDAVCRVDDRADLSGG